MTGLDLESFLQLLRADLGAWASLGLVAVVLGLMAWTSWGSRRALRKCLVLSIAAHVGLVLYGSTFPIVLAVLNEKNEDAQEMPPVRVQVDAVPEGGSADPRDRIGPDGRPARSVAVWDRANDAASVADPSSKAFRPESLLARAFEIPRPEARPLAPESVVLEVNPPRPSAPTNSAPAPAQPPTPIPVATADPSEITATNAPKSVADPVADSTGLRSGASRLRPDRETNPTAMPSPAPRLRAAAPAIASLDLPNRATPTVAEVRPIKPESPTGIAAADGSEVAAPRTPSRTVEADSNSVPDTNLRNRTRLATGSSTGTTALAMLDPIRPRNPLETTAAPPVLEAPRGISSVTPGTSGTRPAPMVTMPIGAEPDPTSNASRSARLPLVSAPRETLPETDSRRQSRPNREIGAMAALDQRPVLGGPTSLPRVNPNGAPSLPAIPGATGLTRPPADVPAVYRSRLNPNRFAIAQQAGATRESEQAVERALAWLQKHQDADGRWDAGTAKYADGTIAFSDDDHTAHCPPGDVCFGECFYWEADSAVTGLALLAYLGSGYTHLDGQYAETVAKGLAFLRLQQKADGDLRGRSVAVGMYCHAMATLALCEAYALTGDPKLRDPVERAVGFIVQSRAKDGMAWRYAPGAPTGDTSILGWVVMVLKSAQEVGIPIQPATKQGVLLWLNKVAAGPASGLAKYQPWEKVTPTMTAEAWVCRQFLGVAGSAQTGIEASDYLLREGPQRSEYNLYYWYYGTLAMYQYGGEAWTRWNGQVRDQIIRRQRLKGHTAGSWDPDDSQYGSRGGRIYCTALATLSLEVYYRYLRLYETPSTSPTVRPLDSGVRRSSTLEPLPLSR